MTVDVIQDKKMTFQMGLYTTSLKGNFPFKVSIAKKIPHQKKDVRGIPKTSKVCQSKMGLMSNELSAIYLNWDSFSPLFLIHNKEEILLARYSALRKQICVAVYIPKPILDIFVLNLLSNTYISEIRCPFLSLSE